MPRNGVNVNGAAIRVIRERSGMSISDVIAAIAADDDSRPIHPDFLRNIELGNKLPSAPVAAAIARALRVPYVAILADPNAAPVPAGV